MPVVSVADTVHLVASNSLITAMRGYKTPTGSETVARCQKDRLGTRESHNVSAKGGYRLFKSEEDT